MTRGVYGSGYGGYVVQYDKEKYQKAYYQAKRDKRRAYGKRYYQRNKDKLKAASRAYYKEIGEDGLNYYQRNREHLLAEQRKYREQKKNMIKNINKDKEEDKTYPNSQNTLPGSTS